MLTTMPRRLVGVAALTLLLVAACGPVHMDPRWASIAPMNGGDQILVAFGDRLTLVDTEDGKPVPLLDSEGEERLDDQGNPRLWEVRGTGQGQARFYTAPAILDAETLLVSSYDNHIYSVDYPGARLEGESAAFDQPVVAAPVVDDERVYVGLADRDLVALDRDGLEEIWRLDTSYGIWAEPVVAGDTLYVASMDHFLYAVNAADGSVLWKTDLQGAITATPVLDGDVLYVGSFAKKLFKVDAASGEILQEFPVAEWIWSAPALVDGALFVADMSGTVHRLDPQSFTEVWQVRASTRSIAMTPLVAGDSVIVASRDQNVYWLDRDTGEVMDSKAVAGEVLANLLLLEPNEENGLDEPLVVASTSAPQEMLVAFTLDRGQRAWVYGR